jgi:hypothetical protein
MSGAPRKILAPYRSRQPFRDIRFSKTGHQLYRFTLETRVEKFTDSSIGTISQSSLLPFVPR